MSNSHFGKSVLIIDHKLEELSRLRDIVSSLGYESVEAASSVNMGMSYLRSENFDLVLVAYDLGKNEKNGLQVIQEAFAEKLRLYQTLFMLVVEPASSALLVGSLETAPDAYISRPYDRAKIQNRLDKLMRVKKAVLRVEEAMDQENWTLALVYIQKLISVYPGLRVYLERLQGICLLESQQYEEALVLFDRLVDQRQQIWARVGQGMAHYFLANHTSAVEVLQQVVDQQHISVEAFSWLARSLQVLGNLSQSVVLMRKAVMLQPSVPQLQSELGIMAANAQEWGLAVEAFRAAIKYARYSVFQDPDNYFALVRSLLYQFEAKSGNKEALELDALRVMEDVLRDFMSNEVIAFKAHLLLSEVRFLLGNTALADAELNQAISLFTDLDKQDQWRWRDWLDMRFASDANMQKTSKVKADCLGGEAQDVWIERMKEGMLFYKKGDLKAALDSFRAADFHDSKCISLKLNIVQVIIDRKKAEECSVDDWVYCLTLFNSIHFGACGAKLQGRYMALMSRYSECQRLLEGL